jgi:diguanylate cyclase (GGDEF)-like protein/PAS domain S-box-containing protein
MGKTEALYKDVLDNLHDGVYFVDRERVITYWNKGAERITGYSSKEALGRSCRDGLLNHVSAEGVRLCDDSCPLAACMADGEVREVDVFLHHADGHRIPVLLRVAPLRDARGRIVGAVESFSSEVGLQTARTELHKLRRSVDTDVLTGVASRRYVASRLRGVIAEMENPLAARAGLLFVDVDDFKQFNDVYGHDAGDKALRMVAQTLRSSLRDSDVLGRWGGEEFMAVLLDVGSLDTLDALAERSRLLVGLSDLKLGEEPVTITVSIGATLFRPGDTAETIVQRADTLMYQSKHDGKNRVSAG